MSKETPAVEPKPTVNEVIDSLTGYEELAIEKAFGDEFYDLSLVKRMRALAFVLAKRGGKNDADAKKAVMAMSQAQVTEAFSDEDDDEGDDDLGIEPATEAGKGDGESD